MWKGRPYYTHMHLFHKSHGRAAYYKQPKQQYYINHMSSIKWLKNLYGHVDNEGYEYLFVKKQKVDTFIIIHSCIKDKIIEDLRENQPTKFNNVQGRLNSLQILRNNQSTVDIFCNTVQCYLGISKNCTRSYICIPMSECHLLAKWEIYQYSKVLLLKRDTPLSTTARRKMCSKFILHENTFKTSHTGLVW